MTSSQKSRRPPRGEERSGRPTSRMILALVLGVVAVVFIIENRQPAAIRVLIPVVTMPLWTALAASVVIGLLIGLLMGRHRR
jgi:uncharacterized integral membrane protein